MRVIDADALLDEVMERHCKECDKRKGIKNGKYRIIYSIGEAPCRACDVDDLKSEIEDAPTIEPEPPWIPVSERLPEQGRPILFCDVDGDVFHGFYKHSQWNEFLASYPIVNVVAWMPQPKSYKGVKNG